MSSPEGLRTTMTSNLALSVSRSVQRLVLCGLSCHGCSLWCHRLCLARGILLGIRGADGQVMSLDDGLRTPSPTGSGASLDSASVGRDIGPPSTRNASKGALIQEAQIVFRKLAGGASRADLRGASLHGDLLRKRAWETRNRIWDALHWRYFAWAPPAWVLSDLTAAAVQDGPSRRLGALLYVHFARRDRLTFDFVTEKLWALWRTRRSEVRRDDVLDFLSLYESEQPNVRKWRESTRKKLAGNVLSALRDFGLLRGVRRKGLQQPVVPPEVALHLVHLLDAEGLRGRRILEALDWRLFLWDAGDVSQALAGLAQRGQLRFERSGSTVVLEIPPTPDPGTR
jgi:hypothetical protein